jgi:hypothetical protein
MNEMLTWGIITACVVGILMLYIEWRNRAYSKRIFLKLDAVMQKLIDIKHR